MNFLPKMNSAVQNVDFDNRKEFCPERTSSDMWKKRPKKHPIPTSLTTCMPLRPHRDDQRSSKSTLPKSKKQRLSELVPKFVSNFFIMEGRTN